MLMIQITRIEKLYQPKGWEKKDNESKEYEEGNKIFILKIII